MSVGDMVIALLVWSLITWWFSRQLPLAIRQWRHDRAKRWTLPFLTVFLLGLVMALVPITLFPEFSTLRQHPTAHVVSYVGMAVVFGCWFSLMLMGRAMTRQTKPSS